MKRLSNRNATPTWCLAIVASLMVTGTNRAAQFTPTFSIDYQGPTAGSTPGAATGLADGFFGAPIDEGQILTQSNPGLPGPNPPLPGPLPAPGVMVDSAHGSALGTVAGGLGVVPGTYKGVEVDALSYGRDHGEQLVFSVDEFARGIQNSTQNHPNVFSEGTAGAQEASADVFSYLGPAVPTQLTGISGAGNRAIIDGNGVAPFGGPGLGLIEPNPPTFSSPYDRGDNLDALDINTSAEDVFRPIFFSLDSKFQDPLEATPGTTLPNTGTAIGNGFFGGDVVVTLAGALPVLYAPASALGLDIEGTDTDDLDALALWDDGVLSPTTGMPIFSPDRDKILFSVRRGSKVVGMPDSLLGLPIEEGDILAPPVAGGSTPSIFIPAENLGLATIRSALVSTTDFSDDLNAMDIIRVVPEPSTAVMLLLATTGLLATRRRRTP